MDFGHSACAGICACAGACTCARQTLALPNNAGMANAKIILIEKGFIKVFLIGNKYPVVGSSPRLSKKQFNGIQHEGGPRNPAGRNTADAKLRETLKRLRTRRTGGATS